MHAARIVETLDADLWPECELRDEALRALGISTLTPLLEDIPRLDHTQALAEAIGWLELRPESESVPRQAAGQLSAAAG